MRDLPRDTCVKIRARSVVQPYNLVNSSDVISEIHRILSMTV
jgi:hypothetical protein